MLISLDGACEETYLKYRIGGSFELVLQNVSKMAEAKRRLGAKRPIWFGRWWYFLITLRRSQLSGGRGAHWASMQSNSYSTWYRK